MNNLSNLTELQLLQEIKSVNTQIQTLNQYGTALSQELKSRVDKADVTEPRPPAPEQAAFLKEAMERIVSLEQQLSAKIKTT